MKYIITIILLLSKGMLCLSQNKPSISLESMKLWPTVGLGKLNSSGEYFFCIAHSNDDRADTLYLSTTNVKNIKKISNVNYANFTDDGKRLVIWSNKDKLQIINLKDYSVVEKSEVSEVVERSEIRDYLFYRHKKQPENLIAFNIKTGKELQIDNVSNQYWFKDERNLAYREQNEADSSSRLNLYSLPFGNYSTLYQGEDILNVVFGKDNGSIAFVVRKNKITNVYYFDGKKKKVSKILSSDTLSRFDLHDIGSFSLDGRKLVLKVKEKVKDAKCVNENDKLNIWSYNDKKLQSIQLYELASPRIYTSILDISTKKIVKIEAANEKFSYLNDDLIDIIRQKGEASITEFKWNPNLKTTHSLYSLSSGKESSFNYSTEVSPTGRFITYYNDSIGTYFLHDLKLGLTTILKTNSNVDWKHYADYFYSSPRGVAGWLPEDKGLLLYDNYDLWFYNLNPQGTLFPLTNNYGKRNKMVFSVVMPSANLENGSLLLTAFDLKEKKNGFYRTNLKKQLDPIKLLMTSNIYDVPRNGDIPAGNNFPPLKAKKKDLYVIKRTSANEFGNFYSTKDFKHFTPLTNFAPEKKINWYTTELISWQIDNGKNLAGIVYKPEDFKKEKKYPVIITYYEKKSDGLNGYLFPRPITGSINIPLMVSLGYIVVAADVEMEVGNIAQSVTKSIVSCAEFLSKLDYIDSNCIGLNGHSFGGFETNILVSNTTMFKAASSSAGVSDLISRFGMLRGGLYPMQESGQQRIGTLMWDHPEQYIRNSPVFSVAKVVTPLLIMHTTNDHQVDFSQSIEFFTALRRLGKKVWLLEYEDGDHNLSGESAVDYTIRTIQFFDHYLRNRRAPLWMIEGRPANLKGLDGRLCLDSLQRKPGPGLVSDTFQSN